MICICINILSLFGTCHIIEMKEVLNWDESQYGAFDIVYDDSLDSIDIPKSFLIFFTPRNDWHGIVGESWSGGMGQLQTFKIDTSSHEFPLMISVNLNEVEYVHLNKKDECIKVDEIVRIRNMSGCSIIDCVPVQYSALFAQNYLPAGKLKIIFVPLDNHEFL